MRQKTAVRGVATLVVVGAAWLGATAWSGQQARARYGAELGRIEARFPFMRVVDRKYDKGFFSSTATTSFQFGCPAGAGAPPATLTLTSVVHHGPIAGRTLAAAVVDSQVMLAGAAQPVAAAFAGAAPLTVRTVVGFTGRDRSTFDSPPAHASVGEHAVVAWQGLSGTVDSGQHGRSMTYRVRSPGLVVSDPASHAVMRIGAMTVSGDGEATSDSGLIMVGKVNGTLDAVEVNDGKAVEPMKIMLTGLHFATQTAINGELIDGTGTFGGTGSVGDVRIDRFEMESSMHRLHAPTYEHLMQSTSAEMYRCDIADKDRLAGLLSMQKAMAGDLMAMLRYGPEISLDKFVVESGGRTAEVAYAVGVDGVTDADARLPPAAVLMAHAHASASARVPIDWLRRLSETTAARLQGKGPDPANLDLMIDQAQAQGYLVRDSDYVTSKAEFAGGVLKVNGRELGPKPRR
ncbi:MAG TPA: YdgA family protein [Caldimonas sp.]|nr:YdgA family protein [Caldimonas sp.]